LTDPITGIETIQAINELQQHFYNFVTEKEGKTDEETLLLNLRTDFNSMVWLSILTLKFHGIICKHPGIT